MSPFKAIFGTGTSKEVPPQWEMQRVALRRDCSPREEMKWLTGILKGHSRNLRKPEFLGPQTS